MNPLIQFKRAALPLLIVTVLVRFGLPPSAQAQLPSPTPDGGYPNNNTAEGTEALFSLTTGTDNTAVGFNALFSDGTAGTLAGDKNTAVGSQALFSNDAGSQNTAVGYKALHDMIFFTVFLPPPPPPHPPLFGFFNTAVGAGALSGLGTGNGNTAVGTDALTNSGTILTGNTAVGWQALFSLSSNDSLKGVGNIALGQAAGYNLTTGNDNIDIGNQGVAGESATIRIGNVVPTVSPDGTSHLAQTATYIAGIFGVPIANSAPVVVDANGHLGTTNTSGFDNTVIGNGALLQNTTGDENTATGVDALSSNTTGNANTANGVQALQDNTTGNSNTADGLGALFHNTTGNNNIALGTNAGFNVTTGNNNIEIGNTAVAGDANTIRVGTEGTQTATYIAGINGVTVPQGSVVFVDANGHLGTTNTAGFANTAIGNAALESNTTGGNNTATGVSTLAKNTTGNDNTANGVNALATNTTGSFNTAVGIVALQSNTTGSNNTATGLGALVSNTTGANNIALGFSAGSKLTTGNNNIDISNDGVAGEANTIRIGTQGTQTNTFIAGISGTTVAKSVAVFVDANGHLGTKVCSARFKDDIKPMDKASEAILALNPVTFRYKKAIDPEGVRQFGLVAEDVQKVNPDLVVSDADGRPYTVRYDAVNAMLLNEFLKEHRTVEELKSTAAKQETIIAQQQKQIEALTAGLQKVSAQVEMNRPAPQVVNNNQ